MPDFGFPEFLLVGSLISSAIFSKSEDFHHQSPAAVLQSSSVCPDSWHQKVFWQCSCIARGFQQLLKALMQTHIYISCHSSSTSDWMSSVPFVSDDTKPVYPSSCKANTCKNKERSRVSVSLQRAAIQPQLVRCGHRVHSTLGLFRAQLKATLFTAL